MTISLSPKLTLHEFIESLNPDRQTHELLLYNLAGGKCLRLNIFRTFLSHLHTTGFDDLGWCIEMLQAHFLITDDIIDCATVRRGKPAWHSVRGLAAIRDAQHVYALIFRVLKRYAAHLNYALFVELFNDAAVKTWLGQCQDDMAKTIDDYTFAHYEDQVACKTTFYTFVLPARLACLAADRPYRPHFDSVLYGIGFLFQVQDDYLNFMPGQSLKSGTDLEEKKVTWFVCELIRNGGRMAVEAYLSTGDCTLVRGLIDEYLKRYWEVVEEMKRSIVEQCVDGDVDLFSGIIEIVIKKRC